MNKINYQANQNQRHGNMEQTDSYKRGEEWWGLLDRKQRD